MAEPAAAFEVRVEQLDGFDFVVHFDKQTFADVAMDEPPPLGHDHAPNAARYLAAAIGNCLAASFVFCAKRAGVSLEGVAARVRVTLARNEERRLRIGKVEVHLDAPGSSDPALARCAATFEDFCVVTQSVRHGVEVDVHVHDPRAPA